MLILFVSPIPFYDYKFTETYVKINATDDNPKTIDSIQYLSDYLSAFMVFRLYFIVNSSFNYSTYRDPFSKIICKDNNFYPSNWFIFKTQSEKRPLLTVFLTTMTMIFVIWYWLLLLELENFIISANTRTVTPEFASLYLTMVTVTTVGFGDVTP